MQNPVGHGHQAADPSVLESSVRRDANATSEAAAAHACGARNMSFSSLLAHCVAGQPSEDLRPLRKSPPLRGDSQRPVRVGTARTTSG